MSTLSRWGLPFVFHVDDEETASNEDGEEEDLVGGAPTDAQNAFINEYPYYKGKYTQSVIRFCRPI